MFTHSLVFAFLCLATTVHAGNPLDEFVFLDFTSYADINQDADFNDQWGKSVALTRGYAFVGSPNTRNPSVNSGVLALFRLPREGGGNWTFEKFIDPPDDLSPFTFGRSVASDGEWLAVSNSIRCPEDGNNNGGVVHLYRRDTGGAGNWGFHATRCMDLPVGVEGGTTDSAIDMQGDLLIVGNATADVDEESRAGVAFVFERNAGGIDNWGQVATLRRPLPNSQDKLGVSVAIFDDVAVVGASGAELDGEGAVGLALVFQRGATSGDWSVVTELRGGEMPLAGDDFGMSVDVWQDVIVVGSGPDDTKGSAHLFYKDLGGANNWGELTELTSEEFTNTDFGRDVAIRGDELMVGTFAANKVFVFKRNQDGPDQWGRTQLLESPEPGAARFGETVAFLNGFAVVTDSAYDDQPVTESNIGAATLLFDDIIFRDDFEGFNPL